MEAIAANPPVAPPHRRRFSGWAAARRHPWAAGILLLLAGTLALRLWWGWDIGRKLAALQAEARRRGEPSGSIEMSTAPLPDRENAWLLVLKAGALNSKTSPSNTILDYPAYPPFGAGWEKAVSQSEQADGPVFSLMRQARGLDRAQFTASSSKAAIAMSLNKLNTARAVANTLGDGAPYRHLQGDDVEAIERLLDILHLSRLVHQGDGIINQLTAMGITRLAAQRAQVIAPGLRISAETRSGVKRLIDALLHEPAEVEEGYHRSWPFERLARSEHYQFLSAGTWVIRPLAEREILRTYADVALRQRAMGSTDAETARRILEEGTRPEAGPGWWTFTIEEGGAGSRAPRYSQWYTLPFTGGWYIEVKFQNIAARRAAAVSLAAQLYRADHEGRWPARLQDLVPAYLPNVPVDPFQADGRPMGYFVLRGVLPGGLDRPVVYFDPGEFTTVALDPEPIYGWQNNVLPPGRDRQHRDLARWLVANRRFDRMRAPTTSPNAVENDPPKPDAPGDDAQEKQ